MAGNPFHSIVEVYDEINCQGNEEVFDFPDGLNHFPLIENAVSDYSQANDFSSGRVFFQTDSFSAPPAPVVTSIFPLGGDLGGGTSITITGTGFQLGATITIDGVACALISVISATNLNCISGANTAGLVDVILTNIDAQAGTLANAFTYSPAPSITSGALIGGSTMTLTGTNLSVGSTITVGGIVCTAISIVSATTITCNLPAHSSGTVDIIVTNSFLQTGTLASGYTYNPSPTVFSVDVASGADAGGTNIIIAGSGFVNGATVNIGGANCTSVSYIDSNNLSCTTGSNTTGTYSLNVVNLDGQVGSLAGAFSYVSVTAPTVSNFTSQYHGTDLERIVDLPYFDNESDVATSCSVSTLVNVIETAACSCSAGSCSVGITSTSSYTGMASFAYSVTANSQTSGSATVDMNIKMPFVTQWQIPGGGLTLSLPLPSGHTYNFMIDWGDASPFELISSNTATHTYFGASTYTVAVVGIMESFQANLDVTNADKLIQVIELGDVGWIKLESAFHGASNLTDFSGGVRPNVLIFKRMFYNTPSLRNLDVTSLNTTNAVLMIDMFRSNGATSLDLSNFSTNNVTSMANMFTSSSAMSLDLSSFTGGALTNMSGMFSYNPSLASVNLSGLTTANVTDMALLFKNATGISSIDLSGFDTSLVQNFKEMFNGASSLTSLDISNFNTGSATNMAHMFSGVTVLPSLTLPANFTTANVTLMNDMFRGAAALISLDLSTFDTTNVTNMAYMFEGASGLTGLDLSGFNSTANVTNMNSLFSGTAALALLDLRGWSISGGASGSTNVLAGTNGSIIVSCDIGTFFGETCFAICPDGYIPVPGNAAVGASSDFCVMKYEAKAWNDGNVNDVIDGGEIDTDGCNEAGRTIFNWGLATNKPGSTAEGAPWRRINQVNAWAECDSLNSEFPTRADIDSDTGSDGTYALILNPEWMAIARNVENIDSNWTSGTIGSGCLKRGNIGGTHACSGGDSGYDGPDPDLGSGRTDNGTAQLALNNGSVIWDFAGNVWEWTDWTLGSPLSTNMAGGNKAYVGGDGAPIAAWREYTQVDIFTGLSPSTVILPSDVTFNANFGMGRWNERRCVRAPFGRFFDELEDDRWLPLRL